MNKDLKRFVLASIIGSLAVMTGCGQKNDGMRKSRTGNGKQQVEDKSKSWKDDDKDSMKHRDKDDSSNHNGCG